MTAKKKTIKKAARRAISVPKGAIPPFEGLKAYSDMLVMAALAEDIGGGDITTSAVVPPECSGEAVIIARQEMVVAGMFIAGQVYSRLDRGIKVTPLHGDGEAVKKGSVLARVSGPLAPILTGERVALNFLQRLSGIATVTRSFVEAIKGRRASILDTRKTTPCFRLLERYAVKMGGGVNHRFGLHDAVLIKDNHIKAAGGVAEAVARACASEGERGLIEVEASNLKEAREAVAAGADIILLDNMNPAQIKKAVRMIGGVALIEVSGGVTLENVKSFAVAGVDFISAGSLTHSAPAADISLEVESICRGKRRG